MIEVHTIDEAVFAAEPQQVFKALVDELTGRTAWWMPTLKIVPKGGAGEPGTRFEIHVQRHAHTRFLGRLVEKADGLLLRAHYTEGDFVGQGLWTFDPVEGGTRVRFRWDVRPHSVVMRAAAPFIDIGRRHHQVVDDGFRGLRRHLEAQAAERHPRAVAAVPFIEEVPAGHP